MADGPDDPKQKADKAWRWCERQWDRAPSPSQMVEAAVTASIEAALVEALAPVLERVARLEELAQFPTLMAENDALLQKMAAASPELPELAAASTASTRATVALVTCVVSTVRTAAVLCVPPVR